MLGIPIIWSLLAVLLAGAIAGGTGWHYGGKVVAAERDAAIAANKQLGADIDAVRRECAAALAVAKADAEKRRKAAQTAARAAQEREATQRGMIDSLASAAASAADSAANCDNAAATLNALAALRR